MAAKILKQQLSSIIESSANGAQETVAPTTPTPLNTPELKPIENTNVPPPLTLPPTQEQTSDPVVNAAASTPLPYVILSRTDMSTAAINAISNYGTLLVLDTRFTGLDIDSIAFDFLFINISQDTSIKFIAKNYDKMRDKYSVILIKNLMDSSEDKWYKDLEPLLNNVIKNLPLQAIDYNDFVTKLMEKCLHKAQGFVTKLAKKLFSCLQK